MKYLLAIPYVNRPDLLRKAVQSVELFHANACIIDNSETGLKTANWPVKIIRPSVPLTFSQTMNFIQGMAVAQDCAYFYYMHNDAEAEADTPRRLREIVEQATVEGRRWGVAFTHYDTLAAMSINVVHEVGKWDTTLPQYFADNDYYRRLRLAEFEVIDTGLPVTHHNNASSTVKSDPRLSFLNAQTHKLYAQYYSAKWGGKGGAESFELPFNGALARLFLDHLRGQELYRQLAECYVSGEGMLLEGGDDATLSSQIEAIRYAVELTRPNRILETGTGKSYFGYVLSHLISDATLFTFDGDPRSQHGVELLNAGQHSLKSVFTLGDSYTTLTAFTTEGIDLAWIDGGHDERTASSDILQAMRLKVPLILCDDARTMPEVNRAIDHALAANPVYERIHNPYHKDDGRGVVFLRRKT